MPERKNFFLHEVFPNVVQENSVLQFWPLSLSFAVKCARWTWPGFCLKSRAAFLTAVHTLHCIWYVAMIFTATSRFCNTLILCSEKYWKSWFVSKVQFTLPLICCNGGEEQLTGKFSPWRDGGGGADDVVREKNSLSKNCPFLGFYSAAFYALQQSAS